MESYQIFRFENPKIKICYSIFYALKPRNIVALLNTPLLGCFCIYCSNVKLKLAKLNISGLSSEYDLFNLLVCKKDDKEQEYKNARCIFNECSKWESTLMKEITDKLSLNTKITWKVWDTEEVLTKKNKISKPKRLGEESGIVADCMKRLIEKDIKNCKATAPNTANDKGIKSKQTKKFKTNRNRAVKNVVKQQPSQVIQLRNHQIKTLTEVFFL